MTTLTWPLLTQRGVLQGLTLRSETAETKYHRLDDIITQKFISTGLKSGKFKVGGGVPISGPGRGHFLFAQRSPGLSSHGKARSKPANVPLLVKTQ